MFYIYFIGTAGSGKSTLTYAFQQWTAHLGIDSITVNLDPGVEKLLYSPDIDIRDWVVLNEVMDEYNLGPNGAQIVCADMLALNIKEIKEVIDEFDADYVLIDTPGQIELFAFRPSSKFVVDVLSPETSLIAFLFEPILSNEPSGLVSQIMLSATVQFRLNLPSENLLSKCDMLKEEEIKKILDWATKPLNLVSSMTEESPSTNLSIELFKVLEDMDVYKNLVPISSETNFGMEDLYNIIQQVYMGGEDLTSD